MADLQALHNVDGRVGSVGVNAAFMLKKSESYWLLKKGSRIWANFASLSKLCVRGKGVFGSSVNDILSMSPVSRSAMVKYHKMVYEVNL